MAKNIIDILLEVNSKIDIEIVKNILTENGWLCMNQNAIRASLNKGYTELISKDMFYTMISKQSGDGSDEEEGDYGYGVWIIDGKGKRDIPYFQGCDPGVCFISEFNPNTNTISVIVSNYGDNVWAIARKIRGV